MQLRPTISINFTAPPSVQSSTTTNGEEPKVQPDPTRLMWGLRDRRDSFRVDMWPEAARPSWVESMTGTVENAVAAPTCPPVNDALEADLHALGCDNLAYAKLRVLGAQLHLHVATIKLLISQERTVLLKKHVDTLRHAVQHLREAEGLAQMISKNAKREHLDRATADSIEAKLPELEQLNHDIMALLKN